MTAYYLVTNIGADPFMSEVLGLKRDQAEGIVDLGKSTDNVIIDHEGGRIRSLAERYLRTGGVERDDSLVESEPEPEPVPDQGAS